MISFKAKSLTILALLILLAPALAGAASVYKDIPDDGEDLLKDVPKELEPIFEAVDLPDDALLELADLKTIIYTAEEEARDCTGSILIATDDLEIREATGCVIIVDGKLEFKRISASIVLADENIKATSDDSSIKGSVVATHGSMKINGNVVNSTIHAYRGATLNRADDVKAYNTDSVEEINSVGEVTMFSGPVVFK